MCLLIPMDASYRLLIQLRVHFYLSSSTDSAVTGTFSKAIIFAFLLVFVDETNCTQVQTDCASLCSDCRLC